MVEKCIIFGIDGADFFLTRQLMDEGCLPNLKVIADKGSYNPLLSTIPPLTPQAWSSFACGVNPGKHGIFDFGEIPFDAYEPRLNTSIDRQTKGFWEYCEAHGLSTAVINLPLSFPAEKMKLQQSYMIGGMHTPKIENLTANPAVQEYILQHHPDCIIDVMSFWYEDMDFFIKRIFEMIEARTRLLLDLRRRFPVDVLCHVWVGLDRVLHAFYAQQDFVTGGKGWKYEKVVRDVYRKIDDSIGMVLNEVGGSPMVMVVSDHGFGELEKDVYLNHYLLQLGYLKFDNQALSEAMMKHPQWRGGYLTNKIYSTLCKFTFWQERVPPQQKSFEALDFKHLKCFVAGLFGNVYIHRSDRFKDGWIEPKSENYYRIRGELIQDLLSLRDQGEVVVDEVFLSEETYSGPFTWKAPDLILNMRNYAYISRGGHEFKRNCLWDEPGVNHSGNHRMEGILFCNIQPKLKQQLGFPATLEDVAPTLLHGLNFEIPYEMDGRVLMEILNSDREPRFSHQNIYRDEVPQPFPLGSEQYNRLKKLGYLG